MQVDTLIAALDRRIRREDQHARFGQMPHHRIFIGEDAGRQHQQFIVCRNDTRKLARFADGDETRTRRFGAVLEVDDLAPHRIGKAGDGLASRRQRDVELPIDETRAGEHPERRRHPPRIGLAIEHGQQGDAHAKLPLRLVERTCF